MFGFLPNRTNAEKSISKTLVQNEKNGAAGMNCQLYAVIFMWAENRFEAGRRAAFSA